MSAAAAPGPPRPSEAANALLALLASRARRGVYEGFLNQLGAELGISATRVSRALRTLRDAQRVEVLQRGHGRHPSRLRITSRAPLVPEPAEPGRPALADRLLAHLNALSSDGVVERPLVDVAKQLDVGAPSVSRALGRLVDDGLARVDRVGTRGRPTRIALVVPLDGSADGDDDGTGRRGEAGRGDRRREEHELREENRRLVAEVARLRRLLDAPTKRRTPKEAQ